MDFVFVFASNIWEGGRAYFVKGGTGAYYRNFSCMTYILFSNSLIIQQVITKKIITVTVVWKSDLS